MGTIKGPKHIRVLKEDNHFQRAEVLKRNREKRTRYGEFLIEGVAHLNLASRFKWRFRAILYASGRPLSGWAQEILSTVPCDEHLEFAPPLLDRLSDKDEPSELLAIVEMKKLGLDALTPQKNGLLVVFDRPSSPGNLGSSIRSADAFGAQGIIVTGHAVDLYDPHVVRGSMGALFALPVVTAQSHQDVAAWVEQARSQGIDYQIIGSSGKGEALANEPDFKRPTILIMGNETVGMSRGYWDICDTVVRIPIGGALSSLNVSCATSVLLYEITHQRR